MPVRPDFSEFLLSDEDVQTLVLQIIGKTAIERNFALQPSDPMMALPAMIKILMEDLVARHAKLLTKLCDFYSDNAAEFNQSLKKDLNEIVVGTTRDLDNRVRQAMAEATAHARTQLREEVQRCIQSAQRDTTKMQKILHFLIIAGILAAGGGAAALAAVSKLLQGA